MYNNFSSKKTKKVISALLATALVATSAPISADAATTKTVGVGKTITYNAKATVKKVTVKNKKIVTAKKSGKKVTIKGKKAGKTTVTVKTTKKTVKLTVKVGATAIAKKTVTTSMNVGETKALKVTATNGKGDTIKFTSNNKATVKVNKASAVANSKKVAGTTVTALKAGTAKITATSKNTGKKKTFTITVVDATPAVTPSTNPAVVATTPAATANTNPGTNPGGSTSTTTKAPTTTSGAATNAPSSTDVANTAVPGTSDVPGTSNQPGTTDTASTNAPETTDAPEVSTNPAVTASPSAVEFTAKQTGEKKITVTNPTAFTKADVTVKRGNSTVTIDNIAMNDEGTSAVITLAGSIVAVDYTVSIGDNKVTFAGEASEVKDIKITSDVVSITGDIGDPTTGKTGVAYYEVINQFGENITAKTSLNANTSASGVVLNSTEGKMTITWTTAPRLNDAVSVVLMYQNTGISTSKMMTVATKAAPAEIETYGVYNSDGKVLTATNVEKELFYYLFRVKDQYGNYMTSGDITTGTNLIINTSSAMTNVDLNTGSLQSVTVDGVNYLAYQIDRKAGTTDAIASGEITVMIIPGGTGKTVTDTISIGSGTVVKKLTVSVNGSVPAGNTVDLDYVALDENGNEVTEYRVLKQIKSSNSKFTWVKEDGVVKLRFNDTTDGATAEGSTVSTVLTLPSYETKLVTINIVDSVEQASIAGIDSSVSTATRLGDTVTIATDKLKFQDQYGNDIAQSLSTNVSTDLTNADSTGKLAVMVVAEDANNSVFNALTPNAVYLADMSGTASRTPNATLIDGSANPSITFTANSTLLGTESFTFKLVQYSTTKGCWVDYTSTYSTGAKANYTQTGAYTTTLTATENKRFVSYKVDDKDTVWVLADDDNQDSTGAYVRTVGVKGVLSNGQTVDLTYADDYKLISGDYITENSDGTYNANGDATTYFSAHPAEDTVKGNYQVVINYTGEKIDRTVTVGRKDPSVATIKFKDTHTNKGINLDGSDLTVAKLVEDLKAVDSYGVDATGIDAAGKITLVGKYNSTPNSAATWSSIEDNIVITISDIDSINGKVKDNGTTAPTFEGTWEAGDSFEVTFTAGTAKFKTTVSVQSDHTFGAQAAAYTLTNSVVPVVEAKGVYKLTISSDASYANGDTLKIGDQTITFGTNLGEVDLTSASTKEAIASAIAVELSTSVTANNSAITYNVAYTPGNDYITFTQQSASETVADALTAVDSVGVGATTLDNSTLTEETAPVVQVLGEYTFKVDSVIPAGKTLTVAGTTVSFYSTTAGGSGDVDVDAKNTAALQASAIATKLGASVSVNGTSYTVSYTTGDTITFTQTGAASATNVITASIA